MNSGWWVDSDFLFGNVGFLTLSLRNKARRMSLALRPVVEVAMGHA